MQRKNLVINGRAQSVLVDPEASLGDVIRKQLLLTGTKVSCDDGHCGACSVIMNGKLTLSCVTKMKRVPEGAKITTIEGVGTPEKLHALQKAFIKHGSAQCGFCIPGFIVSAKALLDRNPSPSRSDIVAALDKHLCRCGAHPRILRAVEKAAAMIREGAPA